MLGVRIAEGLLYLKPGYFNSTLDLAYRWSRMARPFLPRRLSIGDYKRQATRVWNRLQLLNFLIAFYK